MNVRESKFLEFKENVTNTFLKTVSAFANYGTGEILFGVSDAGTLTGVENPSQVCLDIENRINDNLDPVPRFTIGVNERTSVITLRVEEGEYKPYLYKAKAYRRNDTATVEVDRLDLTRLILEGRNLSFEELPSDKNDLTFETLKQNLVSGLGIESFSADTLKTLELYRDKKGFNKAAELLSDNNSFPGIAAVRFGESVNVMYDRADLSGISILEMYRETLDMYRKYYQYEEVKGSERVNVSMIPEECVREAVANAIVHRTWDVNADINVSMYPDKIVITSPGGLPRGVSEEDFQRGGISILRNPIIGNVFKMLGLIEKFGTGIRRIKSFYENSKTKPSFETTEDSIRITLPVFSLKNNLKPDEEKALGVVTGRRMSSSEIARETGFGKSKTIEIMYKLVSEGHAYVTGIGRGRRYSA